MGESSAVPFWQLAPLPLSETQPAVLVFWVSAPVVVLRSRIATPPEAEATYTLLPSALTTRFWASSSALPFWHAPAVPVSETHPAVPPFCASSPTAHAAAGSTSSTARAASPSRQRRIAPTYTRSKRLATRD